MFDGEKTWVFWFGLIILALASLILFGITWYNAVFYRYDYRPAIEYQVPFIVGAVVFILIGLYMMTAGIRKKPLQTKREQEQNTASPKPQLVEQQPQ